MGCPRQMQWDSAHMRTHCYDERQHVRLHAENQRTTLAVQNLSLDSRSGGRSHAARIHYCDQHQRERRLTLHRDPLAPT